MVKISWPYLIKGMIYAVILMIGTAVGWIMRYNEVQGYTILGVVSTINIIAAIIVFYFIKIDLTKKSPEKKEISDSKEPKKGDKELSKSKSEREESDKKIKNATPSDIKK